ncbi:YggS family pyridoxal phosphate-dependent enzyme, partial [Microbacterium sp.]|uniref:YggS family pyridoxal phosphate-dependent enzyme n=1 Tax=Microbacterium sp. TaxID=51671 RepID=UPI002736D30E
ARMAGRDAAEITRIVVTKFHPASLVRELHAVGVRDVGENRQQELEAKRAELNDARALDGLRWHFIGQAQTNKAASIRRGADAVHSVDRIKLADALHRAASPVGEADQDVLDVLVQVNLTDDAGRGGVEPDDAQRLAEHILTLPSLRLRGVMGVAPLDEAPASAFARLHGVADTIRSVDSSATWISAGMTGDFVEAIAAGATHLRIGSAITGPRPDRG